MRLTFVEACMPALHKCSGGTGCNRLTYIESAVSFEVGTHVLLCRVFLEEGFSEEAVADLERRGHRVNAGECNHDRVRLQNAY